MVASRNQLPIDPAVGNESMIGVRQPVEGLQELENGFHHRLEFKVLVELFLLVMPYNIRLDSI